MSERLVIKVVLDDELVRHNRECRENYWEGFWRGAICALGFGILAGGIVAKLASTW